MAENTNIEWCDHTFNPWTGCTKVSPGCANCYAEGWSKRSGIVTWGKGQPRKRTSEENWKQPHKWNYQGHLNYEHGDGYRPRVFCASLADWLDDEVPIEWLEDLLSIIQETPYLDWLLLTKRPENWRKRLELVRDRRGRKKLTVGILLASGWLAKCAPDNVWIGTTVEDQQRADERIPVLLEIPAKVRFLSCEPLLGPVSLGMVNLGLGQNDSEARVHWVICGGESGPNARPMHPDWARDLLDQCQAADVPFLFKQWGEYAPCPPPVVTNIEGKLQVTGEWRAKDRFVECRETGQWVKRVGKKAAGRLLDGREWNQFPTI